MVAKSNKSHDDQVFLLERKIRLLTEENIKLKEKIKELEDVKDGDCSNCNALKYYI